ncbi:Cof-type HAD-IIB family hydrolase [Sporosarcina sp.]|uniref:Cof-type HAD-IIB family hydrolase n=1 Tax=Sporosarcina sp. TaxID=49982 RepID=UPI0026203561|nr:Cof-type HAD-IIB family hydrolase [Sporosarcina sp.]
MEKKIVFFDLDGTLFTHEKKILESTKQALKALQNKGVYTAICTGRAPLMFEWLLDELSFNSYVSMNGQHVICEGKEIFTNPMKQDDMEKLTKMANEKGHGLTYSTFDTFVSNTSAHPLITDSTSRLKIPYPPVDSEIFIHSGVNQVQLYCPEEETEEYIKLFDGHTFIRWDKTSVDMLPAGASKAIGIQKMLEHLKIPIGNSYAFGDGMNDMQMIETVGTGIAMDNAIPEIKEVADLITASCDDDGILKGLLQVGLLQEDEVPLLQSIKK